MIAFHILTIHQRGASRSWLLAALLAGAGLVYWLAPYGNPTSPINLGPYGTLLIGDIPQFQQHLTWTQGGFMRALRGPTPGPANRFVICFFEPAAQADCAAGSNVIDVESQDAHTISRREARLGDWTDSVSRLAPRFAYDAVVTLPETALDKDLRWVAGACGETQSDDPDNSSCTFAQPMALFFTARDLAAKRINDSVSGAQVRTRVEVRNDGRTSGETYRLVTTVWEIRLLPRSNQPLTDVNHASVNAASDLVITTTGEEHPVADYRNGTRPVSEIGGIYPTGWVRQNYSRSIAAVPTPRPAGGPPLAPGVDNGVFDTVEACDPVPCQFAAPRRPAIYAAFTRVNPGGVPWDFEPGDNTRFKNGIYVP